MKKQSGSVLLISLVMLLLITIIGIASISGVSMTQKMANSQRDYDIAFEMAESALLEGENFVDNYAFDKADLQSDCAGSTCWNAGCTTGLCFSGEYVNASDTLCILDPPAKSVWEVKNTWDNYAKKYSLSVPAVDRPRYLIEFLCYTPKVPSAVATLPPDYGDWVRIYRVTALGFGTSPDTRVMLQSTYRIE